MNKIPKRFIRIWLGEKQIPLLFEKWWRDFQTIHPEYDFVTIKNSLIVDRFPEIRSIYNRVTTWAGRSDILRILYLYELGGVYVDTDVMPIKKFDPLLDSDNPFIAKRSSKSFESAVIGSPAKHESLACLIRQLPYWYVDHIKNSASVQTGPAFISSIWFGRPDITHLPIKTFYPYNGFGAPKRDKKISLFNNKENFPEEMYAAHFSNHQWGTVPKK